MLGFVKALPVDGRGTGPILVTFGGNGFDLPLLRYRAFALGVPVPGLHGGGHRNYWHRFGQDHVDLCDVLSGYGATMRKPTLAERWPLASWALSSKLGNTGLAKRRIFPSGQL